MKAHGNTIAWFCYDDRFAKGFFEFTCKTSGETFFPITGPGGPLPAIVEPNHQDWGKLRYAVGIIAQQGPQKWLKILTFTHDDCAWVNDCQFPGEPCGWASQIQTEISKRLSQFPGRIVLEAYHATIGEEDRVQFTIVSISHHNIWKELVSL